MISIKEGNLFESGAECFVNTVNTVGVMGKGIALQFKQAFPANYIAYKNACAHGDVQPGRMFLYKTDMPENPKIIVNFPTKRHWKEKTRIEDIISGLTDLTKVIREDSIKSIAIPPLGCGNGGLDWETVYPLITSSLSDLDDVEVFLYAPSGAPKVDEICVNTDKPKMTLSRAVVISLMDSYLIPDYRLSMLEIQKLAYFAQAYGQSLKLNFSKAQFGPYAENLNHALQHMEGHYIRGYGDRSRNASIHLLPGAADEARAYLDGYPDVKQRLHKVENLIKGLESPYGMELLSTVHFLMSEHPEAAESIDNLVVYVHSWNEHKKKAFECKHIEFAWRRLKSH